MTDDHLDLVIRHLTELRDAGGMLMAYELTPKLHLPMRVDTRTRYQTVDFRAEVVMPDDWRPTMKPADP